LQSYLPYYTMSLIKLHLAQMNHCFLSNPMPKK